MKSPMPKAKTKAETANIHAVIGSDEAEVKRVAAELAQKLAPEEAGDFGLEVIDGAADNLNAFAFILRLADMIAAQANGGNLLARAAEHSINHIALPPFGSPSGASAHHDTSRNGRLDELAPSQLPASVQSQICVIHFTHKDPFRCRNIRLSRKLFNCEAQCV